MLSILTKIPTTWRKTLYVITAIARAILIIGGPAGLFTFGLISPDTFNETVSQWVKILTDLTTLFAAITALANVTTPTE
jgi:hypothetical protein